jgi:hypothetical protein
MADVDAGRTDQGGEEAFYVPLAPDRFESTRATVGPWDPSLQHGGPPIALVARAMERLPSPPGLRLARVSVELLGPVPVAELTLDAEVVRPGSRISLVSATARAGDRPVLRALGWKLAAAEGRSPARHLEPAPALPGPQPQAFLPGAGDFPYGRALEWRWVEGAFDALGPATVWTRARIPLVRGEPMTPLERLLVMLDSANGVSAELDLQTWTFVPVDQTVVLHRHPEGEWVGMAARTTLGPDGIGLTHTRVFDQRGVIGRSLHTLFVARR